MRFGWWPGWALCDGSAGRERALFKSAQPTGGAAVRKRTDSGDASAHDYPARPLRFRREVEVG